MSQVTDVLVLCSQEELGYAVDPKGFMTKSPEPPPPLKELNDWLGERQLGALEPVNDALTAGGKVFQALVHGAAIDRLPLGEFLDFARDRPWVNPFAVQILVKGEHEERFAVHALLEA